MFEDQRLALAAQCLADEIVSRKSDTREWIRAYNLAVRLADVTRERDHLARELAELRRQVANVQG